MFTFDSSLTSVLIDYQHSLDDHKDSGTIPPQAIPLTGLESGGWCQQVCLQVIKHRSCVGTTETNSRFA